MAELHITDEQRNAIDNQIRERILYSLPPANLEDLPITAMVHARVSLGLGINLENACPYMRACDNKSPNLCISNPYRECPHYKTRLAGDVLTGDINFAAVSLEVLAS
jgi:hypothetical protein